MEKFNLQKSERKRRENNTLYVNDLLLYEVYEEGKGIMLHVQYAKDKSLGEKLKLLREGFKSIAKDLKNYRNIQKVTATSWIVTENPGLLEKLGFHIIKEGLEVEKHKAEYYHKKDGPVQKYRTPPTYAEISADDFIKLYGN